MNKKYCFLLETTSPKGSLGLYSYSKNSLEKLNIQPIEIKTWEGPSHSTFITSAFQSLVKTFLDLNPDFKKQTSKWAFLALGIGPGRFTGVRVGVSFAKTLSFALNIPLYPVSSLKILAESEETEEKPILVLLNAFKNSLYMALYQRKHFKLQELIPPCVVLAHHLHKKIIPHFKQELVCVGDGYLAYKNVLPSELKARMVIKENIFPEVKYLARFLQREFNSLSPTPWKALKPVYLRSPVQLICPEK